MVDPGLEAGMTSSESSSCQRHRGLDPRSPVFAQHKHPPACFAFASQSTSLKGGPSSIYHNSLSIIYHPKSPELRYRSPRSQVMQTITPSSIPSATFSAAVSAPPLLMPPLIPSSFANRRVMEVASSSLTSIVLSTRSSSNIVGKNSFDHRRIPGIDDPSV